MPILFKCPKCQNKLSVADDKAGNKLPCPKCGQRLQVPTPPPPPSTDKTMLGEMEMPPELKTVLGEIEAARQPARVELLCPKCRLTFYALTGPPGIEESCPMCGRKIAVPSVEPFAPMPLFQPPAPAPIAEVLPAVPPPLPASYPPPAANIAPNPWAAMEAAPAPQPVVGVTVTSARSSGFECPFCHTNMPPRVVSKISTGGWIMFILLLVLLCWPLCWIALFMTEEQRVCSGCGIKLG